MVLYYGTWTTDSTDVSGTFQVNIPRKFETRPFTTETPIRYSGIKELGRKEMMLIAIVPSDYEGDNEFKDRLLFKMDQELVLEEMEGTFRFPSIENDKPQSGRFKLSSTRPSESIIEKIEKFIETRK